MCHGDDKARATVWSNVQEVTFLNPDGLHTNVTLSWIDGHAVCHTRTLSQAYALPNLHRNPARGKLSPGAELYMDMQEIQVHDHERTTHCTHNMTHGTADGMGFTTLQIC